MMRKILLTIMVVALGAVASGATRDVGGDLSLLLQYENHGANFKDLNGNRISNVLAYVKAQGWTSIRVRLFVDPSNASSEDKGEGVCQDLAYVKQLGAKIKANGLKFMLDFHYSDSWADPLQQYTPAAWASLSESELQAKVYEYTTDCLQQLKAVGATPDFIQIGNEIAYGMLWGVQGGTLQKCNANSGTSEWARFSALLIQASRACREQCPDAKIIVHHDRGNEATTLYNFYSKAINNGVDFDVIGLSYYPFYRGNLPSLDTAIERLVQAFPAKEIMIVETGYYHKWQPSNPDYDYSWLYPISHDGQAKYARDLVAHMSIYDNVTGIYWWWAEANEYGLNWNTQRVTDAWYNAGLWDNETGKVLPALFELQNFVTGSSGSGSGVPNDIDGDSQVDVNDVVVLAGIVMGN
ncbi:MAG: glycosyl hydrolase 53 family protein [Muribaculaceae bacterium]|nr:glycosyl hydrolase 53 family protein [Muribaculaceae bacterium]